MTDARTPRTPQASADAPSGDERPYIDFQPTPDAPVRRMHVVSPSPEQLSAWHSRARRIVEESAGWELRFKALEGKPDDDPLHSSTRVEHNKWLMGVLDRAFRIVGSVLADEHDKLWVEDQVMDGRFNAQRAMQIVTLAMDRINDGNGKTGARAKPKTAAKRATLKR